MNCMIRYQDDIQTERNLAIWVQNSKLFKFTDSLEIDQTPPEIDAMTSALLPLRPGDSHFYNIPVRTIQS
jgi:hypothetical protein